MDEIQYFDEEFSSLANDLLTKYHVPGISIAIVDGDKTYSKGYGYARFPSTLATPDTLYHTGSTTKALVAAAIGVAIKNQDKVKLESRLEKPLSWTTPLKAVLGDDFRLEDDYVTENASIEDALSHRVGIQGHEMFSGPYLGERPREATKRIRHLGPLNQLFRTTLQYNNFMYAVAGDFLETITGKGCGQAVRELLCEPLGMDTTFWHLREVVDAKHIEEDKLMSRGYYWHESTSVKDRSSTGKGHFVPDHYTNFAGWTAAGGAISSVLDYSKWMRALLDASSASPKKDSSLESSSPITTALFEELTSPRVAFPFASPHNAQSAAGTYGLGWFNMPSPLGPFHPIVFHSGGVKGYGAMLYLLPNDSFGVITLGNTALTANLVGSILVQELISRKMGLRSPGRENELNTFNVMMKGHNIAMEHRVDVDYENNSVEPYKAMFDQTAPRAGQSMLLEDFVHERNQDTSSLQDFGGAYEHGAYGRINVAFVPSTSDTDAGLSKLGGAGIDSNEPRNKKLNEIKDEVRAKCHSLRVQFVGERTWMDEYLLHLRTPEDNVAAEKTSDTNVRNSEGHVTWFDEECIGSHGSIDMDTVPGLPTGAEDRPDNGQQQAPYKCILEKRYVSNVWIRLGAALVKDDAGKIRMAMTLGNAHTGSDGTREKGWEGSKVWFDKVE